MDLWKCQSGLSFQIQAWIDGDAEGMIIPAPLIFHEIHIVRPYAGIRQTERSVS